MNPRTEVNQIDPFRWECSPVLLFSNSNKYFIGYFDPFLFFFIIKLINFRGDLTDISAKKETLIQSASWGVRAVPVVNNKDQAARFPHLWFTQFCVSTCRQMQHVRSEPRDSSRRSPLKENGSHANLTSPYYMAVRHPSIWIKHSAQRTNLHS